jgi:lipoprotein-releasing system permease protein
VYQALLTRVYLTTKIMPLLAAMAVTLCTAMVLVVWSVMGGFLSMLLSTGRSMVGDVSITWPTTGFAHYETLIEMLGADPSKVSGATPVIETLAMASLPDDRVEPVTVRGIDPSTYAKVVDFDQSLWWRPITTPIARDKDGTDPRLDPKEAPFLEEVLTDGRRLAEPDPPGASGVLVPAAVPGIELLDLSSRTPEGYYRVDRGRVKLTNQGSVRNVSNFAPASRLTLRVVPFDAKGREVALVPGVFPVANEFRTGVYEVDRRTVLVPLARLQQMLKMDQATIIDPRAAADDPFSATQPTPGTRLAPARVTTVLVRAAPGINPEQLRDYCERVYVEFAAKFPLQVPSGELMESNRGRVVKTWEDQNATLVGAVRKETALVLMLLWLISLVASFLILAIFWAMISEKTKDIGTLRAIGASGPGVAGIWVAYGLVIGVIGAALGLVLASVIVVNINPIHEWLGSAIGLYVWDPRVYYFSTIPSTVEWHRAVIVGLSGVGFSLLGAVIPAVRAAAMKPVAALRFE